MRWTALVIGVACACSGSEEATTFELPSFDQRAGDADVGYTALVNEGYVGCGIPLDTYTEVFGAGQGDQLISGRNELNEDLPYNLTAFESANGVDVVNPNCLQCHAERLEGELIIGLGNHTADYTEDLSTLVVLSGGLVDDPDAKQEWERWSERMLAIAPYTVTRTRGANPADNLAAALFAHRDRETLAWSAEPLLDLPPTIVAPVDVPPWWHMNKKNVMFYTAAGRGDHARIMMTASTLCIDDVQSASAIDAYFPDVRSYLLSIEPPAYPGTIDENLAAAGADLFAENCERCHGTYGAGGSYPNLLVDLDEVGTDDTLARGAAQFAASYVDWFNDSFFGETSHLEPEEGYVAPPLDGIWASAPYFHNGAVPNLELVLNSLERPTYYVRSYDTRYYDHDRLGWPYQELDDPADHGEAPLSHVYDTTILGYGNGGHRFGDHFSGDERRAVLEYLKTL